MMKSAFASGIACSALFGIILTLPVDAETRKFPPIGRAKDDGKVPKFVPQPERDKIITPAGVSKLTKRSNQQALSLLADFVQVKKQDLVVSPTGLTSVYLLLLNGLRGASRTEFATAMGVDSVSDAALENLTARYLKSLSSTEPKSVFGIAGATNEPTPFKPSFSRMVSEKFGGITVNDAQNQLSILRDYVRKKTSGKFGDSVLGPGPGVIKLYSTVYFNGIWTDKFQCDATKREPFRTADGATVLVPTMHKFFQGIMWHLRGKNFQALRMPYLPSTDINETQFAMYVFLPDKSVSVKQLVTELASSGIDNYSLKWKALTGSLSMPRFKIDTSELQMPLPSINGKSFDISGADLSAMCVNAGSPTEIETKQWATIEVNENGTIAASLTESAISLGGSNDETFEMALDRPFVFILGDTRTGNFLFAGVVQNPKVFSSADAEKELLKGLDATRSEPPPKKRQ